MAAWSGRTVLVTGHTGFKGAWLTLWLRELGAEVVGLSDDVPTEPSLYRDAGVDSTHETVWGDVRSPELVRDVVERTRPDAVFHLAAQSLVRASHRDPVATWQTNVLGTVNVLEACRSAGVGALVVATTDKCYENPGSGRPHREGDPLGGADPYSTSKAAAELAVTAWRSLDATSGSLVASVRAGNVIGGGDWSPDRLVPDAFRAASAGRPLDIRYPQAIRPWQDVLDCLHAYLLVAEALLDGDRSAARAWNIGPDPTDAVPVASVVERIAARWPETLEWRVEPGSHVAEAPVLLLDASDVRRQLGWRPRLDLDASIERLVEWYLAWHRGHDLAVTTRDQLASYLDLASAA